MSEENKQQEDKTPGIFSWHEMMTSDQGASTEFYSSLFGWTHEDMDMGGFTYRFFKSGERSVAGMVEITPEMGECPPHWLSYVTVEDIEASTAKAKELGAKVCKEITDVGMGKFAVITDPQGAGIAMWQFAEGGGEGCGED